MNKITIMYHNDTEEEVECLDVGESHSYTMLFDKDERPFRMIKTDRIMEVFIEYGDDAMQVEFTLDVREVH